MHTIILYLLLRNESVISDQRTVLPYETKLFCLDGLNSEWYLLQNLIGYFAEVEYKTAGRYFYYLLHTLAQKLIVHVKVVLRILFGSRFSVDTVSPSRYFPVTYSQLYEYTRFLHYSPQISNTKWHFLPKSCSRTSCLLQ